MHAHFLLIFLGLFANLTTLYYTLPAAQLDPPIEFVVVIPSYNNEKWCIKNLNSVVKQSYPHWSIV
jgi:hypothetical protein